MIGNFIKAARREKLMSMRELASASGVSLTTIYRLENNKCRPNFGTLKLLCTALDVNYRDVWDNSEE